MQIISLKTGLKQFYSRSYQFLTGKKPSFSFFRKRNFPMRSLPMAAVSTPVNPVSETPAGAITGTVLTTDNQPAAFVTVTIRENGVATLTDEAGFFAIKGLQEGVYTLEISMVGLKPQQKQIEVKKDKSAVVAISLSENAKQLTEVIVVSGKRLNSKPVSIGKIEVHPMDLPQSLAVVGQGMIREQQAQRLGDVIKNVNGLCRKASVPGVTALAAPTCLRTVPV
ncbi:MAG: hypothetical protein EOO14_13435 [Chitinophagaceae bacterium]|nr:MAG: hypothetical protein EOO14_13435 [Chitinophagaceae bacterium]